MKKFLLVVLIIVILAGILIGVSAYMNHQKEEAEYTKFEGKTWFDYGIGQYIPTIKLKSGQAPKARGVINNSDKELFLMIENAASGAEDYEAYVSLLLDSGFTEVVERTNSEFIAVDKDDHKVRVWNLGNGSITVEGSIRKK